MGHRSQRVHSAGTTHSAPGIIAEKVMKYDSLSAVVSATIVPERQGGRFVWAGATWSKTCVPCYAFRFFGAHSLCLSCQGCKLR